MNIGKQFDPKLTLFDKDQDLVIAIIVRNAKKYFYKYRKACELKITGQKVKLNMSIIYKKGKIERKIKIRGHTIKETLKFQFFKNRTEISVKKTMISANYLKPDINRRKTIYYNDGNVQDVVVPVNKISNVQIHA
jgi:hypothetical protein